MKRALAREPDRQFEWRGAKAPAEHRLLALQRTAGNAAVARMLARAPAALDLPPRATHLAEYRQWAAGLRDLAKLAKPPASVSDIGDANLWLAKVVATLETAKGIGDRMDLHAESFLVHGGALESEYGAAEAELPELVRPVMERARQTGAEIGALVMSGINASSIANANAAAEPALMPLEQVTEWRRFASRLQALGSTFTTMGVQDAAAACQDAALAMLQARSVASARATWRAGNAIESTVADAKKPHRARNAVDDIFADGGWAGTQTVEKVTNDKGVEVEQINDWCGMFVAAGMFRGAGLDKDLRKAFAHTDNVYDFFRYTAKVNDDRTPLSIWADGRWWLVSEYHQQRGSMRTWMQEGSIDLAQIRPGDVVLIRHKGTKPKKGVANHIVMVESFDPDTGRLVTIEGNVHNGIRPDAAGEATRQADGDLANTAAVRDSSVAHIRDMHDTTTLTPGGGADYRERGAKTVYGVGRPSLVDFEDHEYAKQPVPKSFATLSPDEIRKKGQEALLQTRSKIDAAHHG